jgi:sugar diacid utilization regulator
MPKVSVDTIVTSPLLAGLVRVSAQGGDRPVAGVRLAERFTDIASVPAESFVILGRGASEETSDYRFDMGLRWASVQGVAAVAAFSASRWRPTSTAVDIADRAGIALVSVPEQTELTWLIRAVMREAGGTAELALARADGALDAVIRGERADADPEALRASVSEALGTEVAYLQGSNRAAGTEVRSGGDVLGYLTAPAAAGDLAMAARLALSAAAAAISRQLDIARRARELPIRSRGELLAELLISESAITEDLLDRARQLGVPVGGWHLAVRLEADDLDDAEPDELRRFELLEAAGQVGLQAASAAGHTWYLTRIGRAIVLIRITTADPGPAARFVAAQAAERAVAAIDARLPGLRLRAGVGTPHQGPMGLRASAGEARVALLAARAAGKPPGVALHDVSGVRRMLMEWYASDTARASVRALLAPLEKLGQARRDTALRTLGAYLDNQGSVARTAQQLHLHRNAVAYRLRRITELLHVDFDDPDQRLALQLACRARLLD